MNRYKKKECCEVYAVGIPGPQGRQGIRGPPGGNTIIPYSSGTEPFTLKFTFDTNLVSAVNMGFGTNWALTNIVSGGDITASRTFGLPFVVPLDNSTVTSLAINIDVESIEIENGEISEIEEITLHAQIYRAVGNSNFSPLLDSDLKIDQIEEGQVFNAAGSYLAAVDKGDRLLLVMNITATGLENGTITLTGWAGAGLGIS